MCGSPPCLNSCLCAHVCGALGTRGYALKAWLKWCCKTLACAGVWRCSRVVEGATTHKGGLLEPLFVVCEQKQGSQQIGNGGAQQSIQPKLCFLAHMWRGQMDGMMMGVHGSSHDDLLCIVCGMCDQEPTRLRHVTSARWLWTHGAVVKGQLSGHARKEMANCRQAPCVCPADIAVGHGDTYWLRVASESELQDQPFAHTAMQATDCIRVLPRSSIQSSCLNYRWFSGRIGSIHCSRKLNNAIDGLFF